MRITKDIQKLADECARKEGYFCASYLGKKGEEFIFSTRYSDSMPRTEGLPALVIVCDMVARFCMDFESFSYLNGLKIREYKKGCSIYRELKRKYDENDFVNDEERAYITDIVKNQRSEHDIPIDKETLYDYLEIAVRFKMKLELKVQEWSKESNDGWEYYLELKRFKHE